MENNSLSPELEKDLGAFKPTIGTLPPETLRRPATESLELNELFAALAKAQLEMEVAKTDSSNPFFKSKYADLSSVVQASRPFLAKNGLSVIQRILPMPSGGLFLSTRLCHSSGQWVDSKIPITPPKADIQSLGAYITYLRRYTYASVVGVVSSDEDDDGEAVMSHERRKGSSPAPSSKISKAQLQILSQELEEQPELLETLLSGYEISKLADLAENKYTGCINRIREIKRAKEN